MYVSPNNMTTAPITISSSSNHPTMANSKSLTLKYTDGATQFRLRIATSLLSHRPLLITNIRPDDLDAPGLTNTRHPLTIDRSPDELYEDRDQRHRYPVKIQALPPPSMRVAKRGAAPLGCGCVHFYCPVVKELNPIELTEFGKVKRVRGNAVSCRIPPSSAAPVAHSAKGVMHRLLPDNWIHTNAHSSLGHGKRNKDGSDWRGADWVRAWVWYSPQPPQREFVHPPNVAWITIRNRILTDRLSHSPQQYPYPRGSRVHTHSGPPADQQYLLHSTHLYFSETEE